jgi:hypothetical protein
VAALGSLLVTAGPQILSAVVGVIGAWLGRSQKRSIRLELNGDVLELTGLSSDQQQRLATSGCAGTEASEAAVAGTRNALIVARYDYTDPGTW